MTPMFDEAVFRFALFVGLTLVVFVLNIFYLLVLWDGRKLSQWPARWKEPGGKFFWLLNGLYLPVSFILMAKHPFFEPVMGVLSGIASLLAFYLYSQSIKAGKTKNPSRVGWMIWALAGFVIFLSYWESGARATIWAPFIFFAGPVIVTFMAWKYGKPGYDRFDVLCGVLALIAFIVWLQTADPVLWLALNLVVDFLGLVLILRKSWMGEEDRLSWTVMFAGICLNGLAVGSWSWETIGIWLQPAYMIATGGMVLGLILLSPHRHKQFAAS